MTSSNFSVYFLVYSIILLHIMFTVFTKNWSQVYVWSGLGIYPYVNLNALQSVHVQLHCALDTDQSLYCVHNQHLLGETTIKIVLIAFTQNTAVNCIVPPKY